MHGGHGGILASADERDDFKRVAFMKCLLGMLGTRDDGLVEFNSHRTAQGQLFDEVAHARAGLEFYGITVDVNNHGGSIIG